MLTSPSQHLIEQQPNRLQCEILEGEGGPVKKLEQPEPLVKLHQGCDGSMAKSAVGCCRELPQVAGGRVISGEERDYAGRHLRVRKADTASQESHAELGKPIRDIKSAILGEAGKHRLCEGKCDGLGVRVAAADVTHGVGSINACRAYPC